MRIRTNQTHHDKVKDLFSPMISIFHLSLKNSQRYDHGKKSYKRCVVFFVHNCIINAYTVTLSFYVNVQIFQSDQYYISITVTSYIHETINFGYHTSSSFVQFKRFEFK